MTIFCNRCHMPSPTHDLRCLNFAPPSPPLPPQKLPARLTVIKERVEDWDGLAALEAADRNSITIQNPATVRRCYVCDGRKGSWENDAHQSTTWDPCTVCNGTGALTTHADGSVSPGDHTKPEPCGDSADHHLVPGRVFCNLPKDHSGQHECNGLHWNHKPQKEKAKELLKIATLHNL